MLVYHPAAFSIDNFEGQNGMLAGASALDCATAKMTVATVSGSDITISEPSASFTTHTAMLKLMLQDDAANKCNPTSLKMTMSSGPTTIREFSFTPTAATYTTNGGDGILYFALPCAEDVATAIYQTTAFLLSVTITYTAIIDHHTYTASKPGYTFAAGKYYAGTLTMTKEPELGDLYYSDGSCSTTLVPSSSYVAKSAFHHLSFDKNLLSVSKV